MANKILIIGVGTAGVHAVSKMNIPDSKKLFIDTDGQELEEVRAEGETFHIPCCEEAECNGLYCHYSKDPYYCKGALIASEDAIKECIKRAFTDSE